jgi:mono/diheme cytochrome c family protein
VQGRYLRCLHLILTARSSACGCESADNLLISRETRLVQTGVLGLLRKDFNRPSLLVKTKQGEHWKQNSQSEHDRLRGHDLAFPFNVRRLVGVWKLLFLRSRLIESDPSKSAQWNRGADLVNGPGHCAECHSPRNFLDAIIEEERFAGGRAADGNGWVPNITSAGLRHWSKEDLAWSEKDIASFLADGMNPAGGFAGGAMTEVIRNTALYSETDRAAIATYIASLPPRGRRQ